MVDSHKHELAGTEIIISILLNRTKEFVFKFISKIFDHYLKFFVPVEAVATGGHIKLSTLSMLSLLLVNG